MTMATPQPPSPHEIIQRDNANEIARMRLIISEVDDALYNGSDEDVWPPGLTRGQAIKRILRAVRMADLMQEPK